MTKVFAWQWSLRGPTPVIFHDGIPLSADTGQPYDDILQTVPLPNPDMVRLGLDRLAAIYPLKDAA